LRGVGYENIVSRDMLERDLNQNFVRKLKEPLRNLSVVIKVKDDKLGA